MILLLNINRGECEIDGQWKELTAHLSDCCEGGGEIC